MRLVLEQLEPIRDMANFVRTYGTGNTIPDPPQFINYADPNSVAQRPGTRPAQFQRVTERVLPMFAGPPPPTEESQPEGEMENAAGIGAGGVRTDKNASRSRSVSRTGGRQSRTDAQLNRPESEFGVTDSIVVNGRNGINSRSPDSQTQQAPSAEKTMLKVGNRAYEVDPTNDPQARSGPSPPAGSSGTPANVGDEEDDPLARQMVELQRGATRRGQPGPQQSQRSTNSQVQHSPSLTQAQRPTHQSQDSASQLSPPPGGRGGGPPNKVDYRRSAEFVVGAFPSNIASSRPASPNPPAPVMARPPSVVQPQDDMIQEVLSNYQQSLPGEHKSINRSRAGSYSSQGPANTQRPLSSESMAGVGAQGRGPSPHPFRSSSRAASPNPSQGLNSSMQRAASPARSIQAQQLPQTRHQPQNSQSRRDSYRGPPLTTSVPTAISQVNGVQRPGHQAKQNSMSVPHQNIQRTASPNQVGIVLDPSGRVAVDELADRFNNSRMHQPSSGVAVTAMTSPVWKSNSSWMEAA